jgi:hypothetical protein
MKKTENKTYLDSVLEAPDLRRARPDPRRATADLAPTYADVLRRRPASSLHRMAATAFNPPILVLQAGAFTPLRLLRPSVSQEGVVVLQLHQR